MGGYGIFGLLKKIKEKIKNCPETPRSEDYGVSCAGKICIDKGFLTKDSLKCKFTGSLRKICVSCQKEV